MDGWWEEMDDEILDHLAAGPTSPEDLAKKVGMSPAAVSSCLSMMVADGRIRICTVERTPRSLARAA